MSKYPHGHSQLVKGCRRYDTGEIATRRLKRWHHFNFPTRHFRQKIWLAKIIMVDKQTNL